LISNGTSYSSGFLPIVKVSLSGDTSVELSVNSNGSGRWVVSIAGTRHSGTCEFAGKKNG
jgi:hypothetical protein